MKINNKVLISIMIIVIIFLSWYYLSDPAGSLAAGNIEKIEFRSQELQGEDLEKVIAALKEGEKSFYVLQLPAVEKREESRIYTLYIKFLNGHYHFLWRYDFSEPGVFYGGGGRIIDGSQVGYGNRRNIFKYFKYENVKLEQIIGDLR